MKLLEEFKDTDIDAPCRDSWYCLSHRWDPMFDVVDTPRCAAWMNPSWFDSSWFDLDDNLPSYYQGGSILGACSSISAQEDFIDLSQRRLERCETLPATTTASLGYRSRRTRAPPISIQTEPSGRRPIAWKIDKYESQSTFTESAAPAMASCSTCSSSSALDDPTDFGLRFSDAARHMPLENHCSHGWTCCQCGDGLGQSKMWDCRYYGDCHDPSTLDFRIDLGTQAIHGICTHCTRSIDEA